MYPAAFVRDTVPNETNETNEPNESNDRRNRREPTDTCPRSGVVESAGRLVRTRRGGCARRIDRREVEPLDSLDQQVRGVSFFDEGARRSAHAGAEFVVSQQPLDMARECLVIAEREEESVVAVPDEVGAADRWDNRLSGSTDNPLTSHSERFRKFHRS